jgi:hypothetical protein
MYHGPPPATSSISWKIFFRVPFVVAPISYAVTWLAWHSIEREPPPPPHVQITFSSPAPLFLPVIGVGAAVLICLHIFDFLSERPVTSRRYLVGCLLSPFIAAFCLIIVLLVFQTLDRVATFLAWLCAVYICLYLAVGSYLRGRKV